MKSIASAFLLATSLIAAAPAFAIEYNAVQADKSSIGFVSKQMGVAVNGKFPKFTAQVAFDPAKPEAGKVNISIDMTAVDAGSKDANDEVVGKQWFNVKSFPTANFVSVAIKPAAGGKFEVTGPLTIKGKSQPVAANFTVKPDGNSAVFEGSFVLKRIDFTVGEGPWTDVSMVANDVTVNFRIVAAAGAPSNAPTTTPAAKTK